MGIRERLQAFMQPDTTAFPLSQKRISMSRAALHWFEDNLLPFFPKHATLCALAAYAGLSWILFERGLIGHVSDHYVANTLTASDPLRPDASLSIWFLWMHALAYHHNPFLCNEVWVPTG
jgi:hypothetical protein